MSYAGATALMQVKNLADFGRQPPSLGTSGSTRGRGFRGRACEARGSTRSRAWSKRQPA